MNTYEPTTTESRELEGKATVVKVTRTWNYPAGPVTLTHYEIELTDGTRSKSYQNYANALKAWGKAWDTGRVVK